MSGNEQFPDNKNAYIQHLISWAIVSLHAENEDSHIRLTLKETILLAQMQSDGSYTYVQNNYLGVSGKIYIRTTNHPVCLEIADTGKGIDKETETKLFSPFFSTKPNGQGLGLIFIREVLNKQGYAFSLQTGTDGLTRFRIWM